MTKPMRIRPSAYLRQVIEIRTSEGAGTEEEPVRFVVYYLDPDSGDVLARYDERDDADLRG
jgi:hypothetical protein